MSKILNKLTELNLLSKLKTLLKNHLGLEVSNPATTTLAEYLLDLSLVQSNSLDDFKQKLKEGTGESEDNESVFDDYFVKLIWDIVEKHKSKVSKKKQEDHKSTTSFSTDIAANNFNSINTNSSNLIQNKLDESQNSNAQQREFTPSGKRRRHQNDLDDNAPPKKRVTTDMDRDTNRVNADRVKYEHRDRYSRDNTPQNAQIKKEFTDRYSTEKNGRNYGNNRNNGSNASIYGKADDKFDDLLIEDKLFVNRIYECSVDSLQNYGFFATIRKTLDGVPVAGKREGLCHLNNISEQRIARVSDVVQRGDRVLCKIISIFGAKISLSMKEVDQKTGEDLDPQEIFAEDEIKGIENFKSTPSVKQETITVKKKIIADDFDAWESAQLKKVGLWKPSERDEVTTNNEDNLEEEVEIELNEEEPIFLKGQSFKSFGRMSKDQEDQAAPKGPMLKAAMNSVELAKERRELRERQRALAMGEGGIDQDRRASDLIWEDPIQMEEKGLQSDYRMNPSYIEKVPDWKKEGLGATGRITDLSIKEQRESLPIFKLRNELIEHIRQNQLLVVVGETGSGKTTQITQYLEEEGFCKDGKMIGCTQPRRVAAVSVAKRVAEEYGCTCGEEVGFTIRFEDKTSDKTRIKYMTDGMLLREALTDEMLDRYSVIMLDEAHERQLNTDVLFGLLKRLVEARKDIKIIITSATLDSEKFSSYFNNCPVFQIPGRTYPVEILHADEPEQDYLDAALITVLQIHLTEEQGDILVFLTGQEEIDTACQILYERMKALGNDVPKLEILPIYSALPSEMQSRIFEPTKPGTRKVVFATNIAETSITIDGIYYVVDPGFVKLNYYNPKTKVDTLQVVPISQAAARQRAGRAGRTGPGKCYRLYTEKSFQEELPPNTVPEIQRTNMSNTVLTLKVMGIHNLLSFDFMDPPPKQSIIAAMEQLHALGALDEEGLLTRRGRLMAEFPLEPQMSKALLASIDCECSEEMLTIVSMLNVQNVFYRPKDKATLADQKKARFFQSEGDHLTLLNVYQEWERNNFSKSWCYDNFLHDRSLRRARDVRQQIAGIFERKKLPIRSCKGKYVNVRKAITSGYFAQAARRDPQDGFRTLVDGHLVYLHPGSSLFHKTPDWVIYHSLVQTSKEYMREIIWIDPKWLVEVASSFYKKVPSHKLSRRQKREKIEPLYDKYAENQDEWRLSYRVKQFRKYRNR